MKVGIFDPYLDTVGGGEKYMLTLASCLSKKHDVSIFWDREKEQEIKQGVKERFGLDLENTPFVKNIFSPKVTLMKRLWELQKYDLIVYLSDGSIPVTLKNNVIIHFQFPVEWVKKTFWTRVKLLQVKSIICNSQFTKSYIDRKFDTKSIVIYPPVGFSKNTKIKKENIILHVGRFGLSLEGANFKKQDVMIDVFKKMVNQGLADWKFVLLISVQEKDKKMVEQLVNRAKGFPIEIIENATNDMLWNMYKKAKIYWHAAGFGEDLEKHPELAEHFGIATAEAMGAGAVPVVINAGGQREIVVNGENGFLWGTEEEFIEKTERLIFDPSLWKQFSDAGKEAVLKFSKERFCEDIKRTIETTK